MELLVGIRAIAGFLHISKSKAGELVQKGAPVTIDDRGVMRAEKAELWQWCREISRSRT